MRMLLRFFGLELLHFEASTDEDVYERLAIAGGDFERDSAPLDPADHYGEYEDKFGFHA